MVISRNAAPLSFACLVGCSSLLEIPLGGRHVWPFWPCPLGGVGEPSCASGYIANGRWGGGDPPQPRSNRKTSALPPPDPLGKVALRALLHNVPLIPASTGFWHSGFIHVVAYGQANGWLPQDLKEARWQQRSATAKVSRAAMRQLQAAGVQGPDQDQDAESQVPGLFCEGVWKRMDGGVEGWGNGQACAEFFVWQGWCPGYV